MSATVACAVGDLRHRGGEVQPRQRTADPQEAPRRSPQKPAGSHVRLTRRGRVVVMLALLGLALAVVALVGSPAASTDTPHHATSPTVVVQPGQTLWDIAAEAAPASDPRDVVAEIVDLNNLADAGAIRAGQPLFVPAD
jgi:LysM domain-containing protein